MLSCSMWREAENVGAEDRVGDDILGLGGKGEVTVGAGRATVGAGRVAVGAEDNTDDEGEEEEAVDLVVRAGAGPIT